MPPPIWEERSRLCAKHDLGGMEGLIGVPGTVGGALRMNAGAYGIQIGTYVREVKVYRGGDAVDRNFARRSDFVSNTGTHRLRRMI